MLHAGFLHNTELLNSRISKLGIQNIDFFLYIKILLNEDEKKHEQDYILGALLNGINLSP